MHQLCYKSKKQLVKHCFHQSWQPQLSLIQLPLLTSIFALEVLIWSGKSSHSKSTILPLHRCCSASWCWSATNRCSKLFSEAFSKTFWQIIIFRWNILEHLFFSPLKLISAYGHLCTDAHFQRWCKSKKYFYFWLDWICGLPWSLVLGKSETMNLKYFLINKRLPLTPQKGYSTAHFSIQQRLLERDKQNFIQGPLSVNKVKPKMHSATKNTLKC